MACFIYFWGNIFEEFRLIIYIIKWFVFFIFAYFTNSLDYSTITEDIFGSLLWFMCFKMYSENCWSINVGVNETLTHLNIWQCSFILNSTLHGKKLIWGPDIFYNFTDYMKMINNVINITNHLQNNQ